MPLSEVVNRFADGTTLHGVPKAIKARSAAGRIFWSVVCLAAATMFCFQTTILFQKYFSYPKKITVEVAPSSVPFPSISVCNLRNLDNLVLKKLERAINDPEISPEESNLDPFISNYTSLVNKYYVSGSLLNMSSEAYQQTMTRNFIATNIDRNLVIGAGISLEELIVTCRFGGDDCNITSDFKQFFDPDYYNCFTYSSPDQEDRDATLVEGLVNGWSSVVLVGSGILDLATWYSMIPGTDTYHSPATSGEGVRVVIHSPNTKPYPLTEGFDVPPGYSVSFGVKTRSIVRIGPPHGECTQNDASSADSFDYRLISCHKTCVQRAIVKACNCTDISLPAHDDFPGTPYCTADEMPDFCAFMSNQECEDAIFTVTNRTACLHRATVAASRDGDCGCLPPCHEDAYDVTYSLSKWPSRSFDGNGVTVDILMTENYLGRFEGEMEKYMLYNHYMLGSADAPLNEFSRLNVYIADSNMLKTQESADYILTQLMSDIGGHLGLWIGISVITLAELMELVVDICKHIGRK